MDVNSIFFSLLFSVIGIGFFSYGRKQNIYFLIAGIVLMVYPYFVSTIISLISIGVLFIIAPFVLSWLLPI